jgi:hypothetical protein
VGLSAKFLSPVVNQITILLPIGFFFSTVTGYVCFLAFLLLHHLHYVLCIKLFSLVLFSTNQMYQVCIQDSRDICL